MKRVKDWARIEEHLLEFFIIGVVFGILEDMLAIYIYTGGGEFDFVKALIIAAVVAVPLAIVSELFVDRSEIFRVKKLGKRKKRRK